jgi:hypothetical protein
VGVALFRITFPSFEKPVDRPRYLNVETERRNFRGIGIVLVLAAACGVALALWEPSHQVTSPFATAASSRPTPASAPSESVAAAPAAVEEDDQTAPTVKLSTLCSQRATARRDCANVKAMKEARVTAPDSEPAEETKPAPVAAKPDAPAAAKASAPVQPAVATPATVRQAVAAAPAEVGEVAHPEAAAPQPQKAAAPKVKRPRPAEEAPVERLVRVYDQILPDGRRVPVYRRVGSGGLETGTIVDGEYRPARRANLDAPPERHFGLQ